MTVIFVADSHIKGINDPNQALLADFLATLATSENRPDRVVFLGDIFDFYYGFGSYDYPQYAPTLNAMEKLTKAGVKLTYIEGNHDFSMGDYFRRKTGAEVFASSAELMINGKKIFLAHGDMVDTSAGYRFTRWFLRSFFIRALAAILGPRASFGLARFISSFSRKRTVESGKYRVIDGLLKEFAGKRIVDGYDVAVVSHSHITNVVTIEKDGRKGTYANPGSWMDGCVYLTLENGVFSVMNYSA